MWLCHFPAISAGRDAHIWKVIGSVAIGDNRGQSGPLFAIFGDNRLAIVRPKCWIRPPVVVV